MAINSEVINRIYELIPRERVLEKEPMSEHTSFRIGGPADAFVMVNDESELAAVLRLMSETDCEHILVGNGSNFLVADEGYPGIMIKLGGSFEGISCDAEDETLVMAGSAKLLSGVSSFLADRGLAGFEFASGIPGSVGGAMFMNAGAYGGEMKDIVESVRLMKPDGSGIFARSNAEMNFAYRNSAIQNDGSIVLSVRFRLSKDDPEAIRGRMLELQQKRNSKQPVNYPSAGSTFKRPVGGYAAALIDEAGLRGISVGGAQVSEKHAGFVINTGVASCADVLELMKLVRTRVFEMSGIMLEPEVRLINCSLD